MINTFCKRRDIVILFAAISMMLVFLLCGCEKKEEESDIHSTAESFAAENNPAAAVDHSAATATAMVTVYTSTTQKLSLPSEAEMICGLASTQEQLFVFFTSGGDLFVATFTAEGEFLTQQHLYEDDAAVIYGVRGVQNGGFAVRIRFSEDDVGNTKDALVVYDTDLVPQREWFLPDVCQTTMGPVMTADETYVFWWLHSLYVVSANGELLHTMDLSDVELVSVVCSDKECAAVVISGNTLGICPVDLESRTLGSFTALGKSPACYSYLDGSGDSVLVNTEEVLYRYDCKEQTYTQLMDWMRVDASGLKIRYLTELSQNQVAWSDGSTVTMAAIEPHEIEREIITVAAIGTRNARLEALVSNFNQSSDEYYAVVNYYDDPITLTTQIIAGSPPDVLEMTSVPIALTGKNFVDLLPYIHEDPELALEDFEPGVLSAMLINETLPAIPSSFYLQTIVGRTSNVGTYHNWTAADLQALFKTKGEEYSAFPAWMTSKELMLWVANVSLGQFVDWNSLTCNFDDDFISLLNFCQQMPSEFDEASYTSDYAENVLLTVQMFQRASWLKALKKNYGGDAISYVGFPGDGTTNGSLFSSADGDLLLAIPINAKNKDAGWSLIRQMLKNEWQETAVGLPIRKDVLDKQLNDMKGDPDTPLTDEDIEQFQSVLSETELFIYSDSTIREIVLEEAVPFFMGDTTAAEAAELIDSRVRLYLAEQE